MVSDSRWSSHQSLLAFICYLISVDLHFVLPWIMIAHTFAKSWMLFANKGWLIFNMFYSCCFIRRDLWDVSWTSRHFGKKRPITQSAGRLGWPRKTSDCFPGLNSSQILIWQVIGCKILFFFFFSFSYSWVDSLSAWNVIQLWSLFYFWCFPLSM